MKKISLSNRMKEYEENFTKQKLIKNVPVISRLDGEKFSSFTSSLKKPYDQRLSDLMVEITKYLLDFTGADMAYTVSDEISLIWSGRNDMIYDGKVFKINSKLASKASVKFNYLMKEYLPEKYGKEVIFDCRTFNIPENEVFNYFIFREKDGTRNSITMAARSLYSHDSLENVNSSEKQELLFKKGINWNDYTVHFKRGLYFKKYRKMIQFSKEELERLPEKHEAKKNPNLLYERKVIENVKIEPILSLNLEEKKELLNFLYIYESERI